MGFFKNAALVAAVISVQGISLAKASTTVTCASFSGNFLRNGAWPDVNPSDSGNSAGSLIAGDIVTIVNSGDGFTHLIGGTNHASVLEGSGTYVVTDATAGSFGMSFATGSQAFSFSWSCAHPVAPSSNIKSSGSQAEGQHSNFAINDMLDGIIGRSLGDAFQPFTANANGVAMMVAPGQQGQVSPVADVPYSQESDSPWRMWMAGRYTHASGDETGDQFNGLFGASYRLNDHSTLGLFGGYEGFDYNDDASAELSGNGLTVGSYAAGTFGPRLKLDARSYTTFMNYDIAIGGVTGDFTAQRLGTSLTASYELGNGATSFTPFVRGTGLMEWQSAYTDSAATAHAAESLAQGIIAPGFRLSHTIALSNGARFTPFIAGEADIIFGSTTLAGFDGTTGLSGKVSGGAQWLNANGMSLGLDTSYGGIGSTIQSLSVEGKLTIPF